MSKRKTASSAEGRKNSDHRSDEERQLRGKKILCGYMLKKIDTYTCHTNWVNANALKNRASICFECKQGKKNREELGKN